MDYPLNDALVERFQLQSAARRLMPDERIRVCYRHRSPQSSYITVLFSHDKNRALYGNLMTCRSVWLCPICSARITEVRRKEISATLEAARVAGYVPIMITYTASHTVRDKLSDSLTRMLEAYRKLRSGRAWQNFQRARRVLGSIRATEVTFGAHGWHVHFHELMIVHQDAITAYETNDAAQLAFSCDLYALWLPALNAFSLTCSAEHGIMASLADEEISEYLAKYGCLPKEKRSWGHAQELALNPSKRGRNGGYTPFELLRAYLDGHADAGRLFQEYGAAMKGRHQLQWTKSLRENLPIESPVSDESIQDTDAGEIISILAELMPDAWAAIINAGLRGELLEVANTGDVDLLWDWLDLVPGMPAYDNWLLDYGHTVPRAASPGD